jgi:hypothetical protein
VQSLSIVLLLYSHFPDVFLKWICSFFISNHSIMSILTRKRFIITSVASAAGIILLPQIVTGQQVTAPAKPQKGPPLDKELVKEFVIAGHKDLDKVKAMLKETPDLLNASFDWKDWDWEDAIGGAGHMGYREMALYLLEQGARPTICVAAMLGYHDVVKAFINAFPQMKNCVGPHKISLMAHAEKGGREAKRVVKYLKSVGVK